MGGRIMCALASCLLTPAIVVAAASTPTTITEDNLRAYLAVEVPILQGLLKAAEKGRIVARQVAPTVLYGSRDKRPRYSFRSRKAKAEAIETLKARLANPHLPIIWIRGMQVGQIGTLHPVGFHNRTTATYRVMQVIDENNALIKQTLSYLGVTTEDDTIFWMRMPTKGLISDKNIAMPGAFNVAETKTYSAVRGTNTVFVLELLDLSPYLPKKAPAAKKTR